MTQQTIESFRRKLVDRGQSLLRRRRRALSAEQELLDEREPDWEDLAADRTAAALLESLSEAERLTVGRIQASLERIAQGTYGHCIACHDPIDEDRLRAVPEADRCGGCANVH